MEAGSPFPWTDWLLDAAWALVLAYGLISLAVAAAVARPRVLNPRDPPADWPPVAVLVAARNEARHLPACLASLLALDYPPDRLTVLVGDDASTDGTADVAASFRDPRVRVQTIGESWPGLRGKQNVLAQLAHQTDAPILLFADADVVVPPGWAKAHVMALQPPHVGLSVGTTLVIDQGLWSGVQALDWLVGAATLAAFDRWHHPLTAVGNNLGLTRAAYAATGGYEAIPFSVTEDFALFQAVRAQGYRTAFLWGRAACSGTWAIGPVGDLLAQRLRWLLGGLRGPWYAVAAYSVYQVAPWVALGVAVGGGGWAFAAWVVGADAVLVGVAARAVGRWGLLRWLPVAVPKRLLLQALVGLRLLRGGGVRWKGRLYTAKGSA
mgnify:CR=1 FL=1